MRKVTEFVPTSIGKNMTMMLRDIHRRRAIAIFAGPPGIGKTTAIQAFEHEHTGQVAIIKTEKTGAQGVGARMLMQEAIQGMRALLGRGDGYVYRDTFQVKQQLATLVHDYAHDRTDNRLWPTIDWQREGPSLTFVFDEAQNLSRDAIETLRYWNDRDRCFGMIPIALAFVGNGEFSLEQKRGNKFVISQAVADRAKYTETFDYSNVENTDIRLILGAHGITDELVVAAVIKRYDAPRRPRSIRRLVEVDIPDMKTLAGDRPVTLETAREALAA